MEKHLRKDYGGESWPDGYGFLVVRLLLGKELIAGSSPQGIIGEETCYGMRMYHTRGMDNHGSAMLFSFVFLVGEEGVVIVSPHLVFLCFLFALPLVAVAVCVLVLFARGFYNFVVSGVPILIMVSLWQMYAGKFILKNVYCGQKKYDQMSRQFIEALRKSGSITIVSMKKMGLLAVFISLAWRYLSAWFSSCRRGRRHQG